jgi:hypothetical protein
MHGDSDSNKPQGVGEDTPATVACMNVRVQQTKASLDAVDCLLENPVLETGSELRCRNDVVVTLMAS